MQQGGTMCPFPWGQHPDDPDDCPACHEQIQQATDEENSRMEASKAHEAESARLWDDRDDDEPHGAPDREWSEIQQDRIDLYMNEF